jgi:hypothetical protein
MPAVVSTRLFSWVLRIFGIFTTGFGVSMLIANGSSPDPLSSASLILVAIGGLLLLAVSYRDDRTLEDRRRPGDRR